MIIGAIAFSFLALFVAFGLYTIDKFRERIHAKPIVTRPCPIPSPLSVKLNVEKVAKSIEDTARRLAAKGNHAN